MKHFFIFLFALQLSHGSTIAIIDSGLDVNHEAIGQQVWKNQKDTTFNNRDEDRNGYQDDVYGWNFANNNNRLLEEKYLGTFSETPYRFFEIQLKQMLGEATPEDEKWIESLRGNQEAIKELGIFGNFVHGTHVAGITLKNSPENNVLGVKLIPTEVELPFLEKGRSRGDLRRDPIKGAKIWAIKRALDFTARAQMTGLKEIAAYVGGHGARVANGSFGTGTPQALGIVGLMYKFMFPKKEATQKDLMPLVNHFFDKLIMNGQKMMKLAPKTLFVFAAGNDGLNNDEFPVSPANIKTDNAISVAATYGRSYLAPFSNYGLKKVDVAAPGMGIDSAIPGGEYLVVSGTSQAAPYVANIAGKISSINAKLLPGQIKKILMETVDVKDFLKGKVKSNGIVNPVRAVEAAQLSLKVSLNQAISQSKVLISDVVNDDKGQMIDPFVLPLQTFFEMPEVNE